MSLRIPGFWAAADQRPAKLLNARPSGVSRPVPPNSELSWHALSFQQPGGSASAMPLGSAHPVHPVEGSPRMGRGTPTTKIPPAVQTLGSRGRTWCSGHQISPDSVRRCTRGGIVEVRRAFRERAWVAGPSPLRQAGRSQAPRSASLSVDLAR